jgi:hypothetical protein
MLSSRKEPRLGDIAVHSMQLRPSRTQLAYLLCYLGSLTV